MNVTTAHHHDEIPVTFRRGTGLRLAAIGLLLAIGLGWAFFSVAATKAKDQQNLADATAAKNQEAPPVETITVGAAPPEQTLRLPAEARGWYASTIFARVSGYVTQWLVDIGDEVKKNQPLAIIDTPELDAQLDAAKAQLQASQAEVKVREADAEFAKTTFDRWEGSARGVVSEQEREDKKANYASSAAKLNAAKARVTLDESNVNRLTFLTKYKEVAAPYDGIITDRRIDIGDLVTAGSTANTTPLFGIAQFRKVRVFANIPQSASDDIAIGSAARVVTTADRASQTLEGKVSRTSQSIDFKSRTLRVEVDLDNPKLAILPGTYLQVEFPLKSKNYVQIPASALLFNANGPQVAIVTSNNTVKFQNIVIGRDNGNVVEVASGLSSGDRVALNISNQIAEGMTVSVKDNSQVAAR